jgi:hypothetical protein
MNLEDPLAFFRLLNDTTSERLIKHKNLNGYQKNLLLQAIAEAKRSEPDMKIINTAFMMLEYQNKKHEEELAQENIKAFADELIAKHQKDEQAPSVWSNKIVRYGMFVMILVIVIGGFR